MDTNTAPLNSTRTIKPIEIFKPGTFIAANGTKHTFTAAQLQEMVDSYNPDFADAPLVVGHPKLNDPRYGRASRLFINDAGVVCAMPDEVCPEFAEAVNAKHYKRISASIYLPDAPGNPVPGKHYLRHIGFLGGAAPAVKGLKAVEFSDSAEGIVEFGYDDRVVARLFRRLRDWLVAKEGPEKAQEVIADYDLDYLTESAIREDIAETDAQANAVPGFSETNINQEEVLNIAKQQEALDARAAELEKKEAELAKKEAAARKAGHADFAESLCVEGKLLPAQKTVVVEILNQLDAANQVADFAEGDANHGKTGIDLFKGYLAAQPKQVEFNRVSQPGGTAAAGTADFAAPAGMQVDQEGLEKLAKAQAYMKEHPGTDFIAAVQAVEAA